MKLFLSGWEAELVKRALTQVASSSDDKDREHAERLLERIDRCEELQNHYQKKPT